MAGYRASNIFVAGYVRVSSDYSATAKDRLIGVDASAAVTITLPAAATLGRDVRIIVKDESGNASVNPITVAAADTIDGAATDTISTDYGRMGYYSNGSVYFKV